MTTTMTYSLWQWTMKARSLGANYVSEPAIVNRTGRHRPTTATAHCITPIHRPFGSTRPVCAKFTWRHTASSRCSALRLRIRRVRAPDRFHVEPNPQQYRAETEISILVSHSSYERSTVRAL